jgi:guanylate kinase
MNSAHGTYPTSPTPKTANAVYGCLFIVSAPSGTGKTTLCAAVRRRFNDLAYSVSYTTRSPRSGERDGTDYHFITAAEFEAGIQSGRWAEWAKVHGHYYGTSAQWINKALSEGRSILMDIDVKGARQMVARFPYAETIFIMPPSMEELHHRLLKRGTDDPQTIQLRLKNAQGEMAHKEWYKHLLVNDELDQATQRLIDIIETCRRRGHGQKA